MSQITYDNKVTLVSQPDVANENKVTASDMNEIKTAHNDTDTKLGNIGKLLWSGNFTTGSITVDGLDDYTVFIYVLDPTIYCIGSKIWGVGGIGTYASYNTQLYNYRFNVSGNTLSIDNNNKGGSNGTSNVALKAIYGLF